MKKVRIRIKKKAKAKKTVQHAASDSGLEVRKQQLKKKRKTQRLKRRFYIFMLFFIAIGTVTVLLKAPFFNIREVICVGQERLSEKEILSTARIAEGQNIFLTNISGLKERVAAIPFVSESNARRIFPDKVKIWVREAVPTFAVEKDGKFIICDVNTKVLEVTEENKDNLCILTISADKEAKPGEQYVDAKEPQGKKLLELIGIMENLDMTKYLNNIDFSDISDIIILYDSRLRIKIGNTNDMEYKLKFINKVINEKISKYEKATVDYTGDKLYVGQYEEKKPETEAASQTEKADAETENAENTENTESVENNDKENKDEQKTT